MSSLNLNRFTMTVLLTPKNFSFYRPSRRSVLIVVLNCAPVSEKISTIPQTSKLMTSLLFRIFDSPSKLMQMIKFANRN